MAYALRPYLTFPGTAREALEFYRSIFGGELTVHTFASFHALPEGSASGDKVMHADLVTEFFTLHASDAIPEMPEPVRFGENVNLSLMGEGADALEELTVAFEKLGDGGRVTMPLALQMWGDHYGALVDRFGTAWMVDVHVPGDDV
ncbi:VOC family protein [Brachybacterium hainanense]|uniref:VOC family protein n=1 Tax=Brachybacterium hainanense TaxID=1541174 RepID=A0ABV6RGZ5_9MICO